MSDRAKKLKKHLVQHRPKAQQVVRTLGNKPADELFDLILAGGIVKPQVDNPKVSDDRVLDIIDEFLSLELENVQRTGHVLANLAAKLDAGSLATLLTTHTMPAATYGVTTADSITTRAAKWVCSASQTTHGDAASITDTNNILAMAVAAQTPMNDIQGLDYINQLLLGQGGRREARPPVILPAKSPLPSSPGGRRMLEVAVGYLKGRQPGAPNCPWTDLGCFLFGAVVACHGFPDANGRTARVLYAICRIRSGAPFSGLTRAGEDQLTGLP